MMEIKRGVVIDHQGYFVAAVQWDAKGLPPRLNFPRQGQRRVLPEDVKTIVTDPEAIADPQPNGRWNRAGKVWEMPSAERWVVRQRRDMPHLWALTGKRAIWPERPPKMPQGVKLIDVPPPDAGRGRRPIWDDQAQSWIVPHARAVIVDGIIQNVVASHDDSLPDSVNHDDLPDAEDEIGNLVKPGKGDRVEFDGQGNPIVTINRRPVYESVSGRAFTDALAAAGRRHRFVDFLAGLGYSITDFEQLDAVSLSTTLVRDFFEAEGMTIAEAHTDIMQSAVDAARQSRERLRAMAAKM